MNNYRVTQQMWIGDCAPTVHESNVFIPFGLLLSEKQIPRFIGNVSS